MTIWSLDPPIAQTDLHVQTPTHCAQYSHTRHATMHPASVMPSVAKLSNGRSADHRILTVPPQDQLELKESYIPSQTPRPGRKSKMALYISPAHRDLPLATF